MGWGAVAWNDKTGDYDTSLGEHSKTEAINVALRKCGAGCETIVVYANQCVAVAVGPHPEGRGFLRRQELDVIRTQAEQKALAACSTEAKNCQILFTECSLP